MADADRGVTNWAKKVDRLTMSSAPAGAVNLNVDGRRLTGPLQGFGAMWQKTYRVRLPGDVVEPAQLISTWKERFPEFWPGGNHFYGPLTGIAPGEVALLNLALPGRLTLSTGVMVLYADEESFTLMTPQGHMFAGWITFSAVPAGDDGVMAQVQVLMRASDPIFELGLMLGGHAQEDRFWQETLTRLAAAHGVPAASVQTTVICVDRKRQWSKWRNVWHSAAIRSSVYTLGAPARLVRARFRRTPETHAVP